jgi:hypothetical protein
MSTIVRVEAARCDREPAGEFKLFEAGRPVPGSP